MSKTNLFWPQRLILIFVIFLPVRIFGQCENLTGNNSGMNNWKNKYREYWAIDSAFQFITADSVLIFYITNEENETNYGFPCCYFLAEQFAQTELKKTLKMFYSKLEKEDSLNFYSAQLAWQHYYDTEWKFLKEAFVAYANFSKYGLGREIMIHTQVKRYDTIKERILTIRDYIETISDNR